jgi:probable DNA repair protein
MSLEHWWLACYRQRSLAGDILPGLLTPIQERAVWLRCVESGQELALLRPGGAAELAAEAYRNLQLWGIDWQSGSIEQEFRFGEDSRLFLKWARRFEQLLEELGLATLPALVPLLADRCAQDSLVLAEFDELPPLYRESLERQAGTVMRHRLGEREAACSLQACDSSVGELEAAGRWAADQHRANPMARIGILHPRLQTHRLAFERILQREFGSDPRKPDTLPVNFSAGVPLIDCGPVRSALGLLALPVRDIPLAELAQLLHSRFRSRAELELEELAWQALGFDGCDPVTPAMLRHALGDAQAGTGQRIAILSLLLEQGQLRVQRAQRAAAEWPERFVELLGRFGWPGSGPLDSLEYQQVEQFYDALAGLSQLAPLGDALNHAAALAALEQICARRVFQPQTADAPVQVLGLLEAAGLQFDKLWICGMTATDWPPPPSPNPFIPFALQRIAKMPHADSQRELDYASQLLAHLRACAGELIASYARQQDESTTPPTAMVADFVEREPVQDALWPAHWARSGSAVELVPFVEEAAPALRPDETERVAGGSAIISDQARCPFRAFARHRLGAAPLPEPEPALSAAERGSLLHDALYELWRTLENSENLRKLDAAGRASLSARSAGVALDGFRQRSRRLHSAALLEIEERRLADLLCHWLAVELQRADFIVTELERKHELSLGGLLLTLRVDRIDTLANGRKLLIDYKSGDPTPRSWLEDRPEDPQLPLYTLLLEPEAVEGVSFAVLRETDVAYRGLARSDQGPGISADVEKATARAAVPLEDWDALQAHWNRTLSSLAREFLEGRAVVAPLDPRRTCRYCGLEALCRIG